MGGSLDDHVSDFMERYTREYDYYVAAANMVASMLESDLRKTGIRCIITHRAKSHDRLESKCRQRHSVTPYLSVQHIYEDIVDLSGVRVALYFPAERDVVARRISDLFHVTKTKNFPEPQKAGPYPRRFAGYSASHHHVRLKADALNDRDERYAAARVEIQIASVLMHAWSEVDHDLAYKPFTGALSDDEYAILDQLNGLVLTGEAMLEQLQRAGERRISESERFFSNQYELAAHLLTHPNIDAVGESISEAGLGNVRALYELLTALQLHTPSKLRSYLESVHGDLEVRPLAEQVIDALLAEDPTRYSTYRAGRAHHYALVDKGTSVDRAVSTFLASWISIEKIERRLTPDRRPIRVGRYLSNSGLLPKELARDLDMLRNMRNALVHGIETPSADVLTEAAHQLDFIASVVDQKIADGSDGIDEG